MALRDVLCAKPRVLFVGINPGLTSDARGHHFAGNGNPFWRLLHTARLTPRLLTFAEDQTLVSFRLALTNVCPRATRSSSDLSREELADGGHALIRKVQRLRPAVVALVGITLYPVVLGKARLGPDGPGWKRDRLGDARVFVLPNPSGLNASYPTFASKLKWFRKLKARP